MRLLYVSVHQVLEHDEVGILSGLGHYIFSLGSFFGGASAEQFRPGPPVGDVLHEDAEMFAALGGAYAYGALASDVSIPRQFIQTFDAVIVMHDLSFIEMHWEALRIRPVIWRSIGVSIDCFEPQATRLRARGMTIVRYSPMERRAENYAGEDALIRFGKADPISAWQGGRPEILTFCHAFQMRYPVEYAQYRRAVAGRAALLTGAGNTPGPGVIGSVSFEEQQALLRSCTAYFYASGGCVPYTLNFIEAWMAGIPLVATTCRSAYPDAACLFAEVPDLVKHSETGFLVSSALEAAETFRLLTTDTDLARRVGDAGAKQAKSLFGADVVGPQWDSLLKRVI